MNRFSLKVAIVTGGSSGIGQEVATRLVQEGAKVVITGRDLDKLKAAAEQIDSTGQYIAYCAADIAEPNTAQQLIDFTTEKFGGVVIKIAVVHSFGNPYSTFNIYIHIGGIIEHRRLCP